MEPLRSTRPDHISRPGAHLISARRRRQRKVCELAKEAQIDIGARCSTFETSIGQTAHVPPPTGVLLIVFDFPNSTINNVHPRVRIPVFRISTPLCKFTRSQQRSRDVYGVERVAVRRGVVGAP